MIAQSAEPIVRVFLEHGAIGVLALAFLAVLLLWWRSDKRNQIYADSMLAVIGELKRAHLNEALLIEVVSKNTEANTKVTAALQANTNVLTALEHRILEGSCPFAGKEKRR